MMIGQCVRLLPTTAKAIPTVPPTVPPAVPPTVAPAAIAVAIATATASMIEPEINIDHIIGTITTTGPPELPTQKQTDGEKRSNGLFTRKSINRYWFIQYVIFLILDDNLEMVLNYNISEMNQ